METISAVEMSLDKIFITGSAIWNGRLYWFAYSHAMHTNVLLRIMNRKKINKNCR